jgi:hypothetical protein
MGSLHFSDPMGLVVVIEAWQQIEHQHHPTESGLKDAGHDPACCVVPDSLACGRTSIVALVCVLARIGPIVAGTKASNIGQFALGHNAI